MASAAPQRQSLALQRREVMPWPTNCKFGEFFDRRNFKRAVEQCQVTDPDHLTAAFERWLAEHNKRLRDLLYTSPTQDAPKPILTAKFRQEAYGCWAEFLVRFAQQSKFRRRCPAKMAPWGGTAFSSFSRNRSFA